MAKSVTYSGGSASAKGKDTSTGVCAETNCKNKGTRLNFCTEHFQWFKFGVITKKGIHPLDFESKMTAFLKSKK